jgi:4-coumarate--CoA ligase (photoactive yellow protein activation family)
MPEDALRASDASAGAARPAEALAADRAGLERLIVGLVAEEVGRLRARPVPPAEWRSWTADTTLDEDGVGIDSLARLEVIARLDQTFALSETGVEDYLFIEPRLGDWLRLVSFALAKAPRAAPLALTFQTSGSTGAPKTARHALSDLAAEIAAHATHLPTPARVLALTPPQHIYGFLFGVLAPALWGAPVLDLRGQPPGAAARLARAGDLVLATPFLWDLVARTGAPFAPNVTGLTSTAPAPPKLWEGTAALGLSRLVEIYGSSETAGVGWRDAPGAPFRLLDHLDATPGGAARGGEGLALQDRLDWTGLRAFRVEGRLDGAVQVGGVNVHLDRVRARLLSHPAVADCALRLDGPGPAARLKAFVVPADPAADADALRGRLLAHCQALLPPERPTAIAFGPALPRDPMGKPADWAG